MGGFGKGVGNGVVSELLDPLGDGVGNGVVVGESGSEKLRETVEVGEQVRVAGEIFGGFVAEELKVEVEGPI